MPSSSRYRRSTWHPLLPGISLAHCAAAPLAALTAWQALFDLGQLQSGQSVLIHGAAGSVGQWAIQFARAADARVTATASPSSNHELVLGLGAEHCVDYASPGWCDHLREFDLVLDGAGGPAREALWSVLKRDGMLIAIAMPPIDQSEAAANGCRGATARVVPDGTRLRKISTMIDAGRVRVLIDSEFPLAEVAAAHARSESRHARGKVLLAVHSRP